MMKSKVECGNQGGDGDNDGETNCKNGQLLRDIEEISKALYLHKTPSSKSSYLSPFNNRSKSAEKSRFSKPQVQSPPKFQREDLFHNHKKLSSSAWKNWKKPLKALTHIGYQKFKCCFSLHVLSIEGLPSNFNGISLCVHWKRKSSILQTRPSRVFLCSAEFDETLMHKCSVFGSHIGTSHSVRYDSKRFLVYASIVGAPEHDIGNHQVDLTRLLPLSLEELRGDKSSGKWTTSFRLAGKAAGASLNVSFSYQVLKDELTEHGGNNLSLLNLMNLELGMQSTKANVAELSGNNRRHRLFLPAHSDNVASFIEELPDTGSGFSKSISFLYKKLDEGNLHDSALVDSEHLEPLKSQTLLKSELLQESNEHDSDDSEYFIIEQGVETSEGDSLKFDPAKTQTVEIINVDEIIKDDDDICTSCSNEAMEGDNKHKCRCVNLPCTKAVDTALETSESVVLANLDPLWPMDESLGQEHYMNVKSSYKAHITGKKSHSLDDITESVASDFLNMLSMESGSFGSSCDDDPQSPREQLLRQFEKEALALDNFTLDDLYANEEDPGTDTLERGDCVVDSDLSLIVQAAEEEQARESHSLICRGKVKILEDLETDSLMQQYGLNESDFETSPGTWSGGFGSPIELPNEESSVLPSIEQGLGSFIQTTGGGFLRSMNPSFFRNAKHGGNLIIQSSNPIILPAEMGNDILEILLHVASAGVEELCNHVYKLMPLQDITGKSIKHIVWDATTNKEASGRQGSKKQDLLEEFLYSYLTDESMGLDSISLEAVAPMTINKVETLLIEGLRIQSGMSNEEAPSYIHPQYTKIPAFGGRRGFPILEVAKLQPEDSGEIGNDVHGMMGLSMTLDQWLRLDSGIIEGDQNLDQVLKILKVHHSKITELDDGGLKNAMDQAKIYGRKFGLMGNHLTVASVIQLRDPQRNYDPVGVPMLVFTQVERVDHIHSLQPNRDCFLETQEKETTENEALLNVVDNRFKINGIHLAGVNTKDGKRQLWGTRTQQQSGFRWLRRSGMDNSSSVKHSSSKLKSIVRSSSMLTKKFQNDDILWSISYANNNDMNELAAENVHIRNPDVIFVN